MKNEMYDEAARNFPTVYSLVKLSLLDHFPAFLFVKGMDERIAERAAEITFNLVDGILHDNQIQFDESTQREELDLVQLLVVQKVDQERIDNEVREYLQDFITVFHAKR